MSAAILTIGNEVVSGDTPNTNATWLAQRLESAGGELQPDATPATAAHADTTQTV